MEVFEFKCRKNLFKSGHDFVDSLLAGTSGSNLLDVHDCAFVSVKGAQYGARFWLPNFDRLLVILQRTTLFFIIS